MARLRSRGFKLQWSAKSFQFSRISCTFLGGKARPILGDIEAHWFFMASKNQSKNEFKWLASGYGLESQVYIYILRCIKMFFQGSACSILILDPIDPLHCRSIPLESNNSICGPSGTHSSHVLTPLPCSRSIASLPCRKRDRTTSCHHYLKAV